MRGAARSAVLLLALAGAGAPALAKSALSGCDAFVEKLRLAASDMRVEFTHVARRLARQAPTSACSTSRTKVDVDGDADLPRRRIHAFRSAHRRAGVGAHRNRFRAILGGGDARGDRLGREPRPKRCCAAWRATRANISTPRGSAATSSIAGKTEEHAPGGVSLGLIATETDRAFIIVGPQGNRATVREFRFHHLERRPIDQALPDLLERAYRREDASSSARLPKSWWSRSTAAVDLRRRELPAARRGGRRRAPVQPVFLTTAAENPNGATVLVRLSGAEFGRIGRRIRPRHPAVRRPRRRSGRRSAAGMEAPQGQGLRRKLLARRRGRRLGAGALRLADFQPPP